MKDKKTIEDREDVLAILNMPNSLLQPHTEAGLRRQTGVAGLELEHIWSEAQIHYKHALLPIIRDYISHTIKDTEKRVLEEIRKKIFRNRKCRSHEPENCNLCEGRQEALTIIDKLNEN